MYFFDEAVKFRQNASREKFPEKESSIKLILLLQAIHFPEQLKMGMEKAPPRAKNTFRGEK